jgi:hypothetical protein
MSRHDPPSWFGRAGKIRLRTTVLVGLAIAAFSGAALFVQTDSAAAATPKTKPSSENPKPPADDSQGAVEEPPTVFSISKPLTTDDAWKRWKEGKGHQDYVNRVHVGDLDRDALQIISTGIREQIHAMSLPTQRDKLGQLVADLLRSVHGAADAKPAGDQRSVREAMIKEIIAGCRELEDNQFHVRLNAAVLLGNLFVASGNPTNQAPPEFYTEAFDALMRVLEKEGQPEAVKIMAVVGLRNAALYGSPPLEPSRRIRLARKLRDELDKTNSCEWYQERLCEALGSIDQIYDLDGKPFIIHALAKALFDHDRPLCARAAAAKALGRAELPPEIDLNVVAYGIADLSRQIVEARNERKKHIRRWCVMNVLLAFKPRNALEKANRAGLLERVEEPTFQKYKESIKGAYGVVAPMVVQELKEADADFPAEVLTHIVEWLKSHTPAQLRIYPGLPPIATTQVTKK